MRPVVGPANRGPLISLKTVRQANDYRCHQDCHIFRTLAGVNTDVDVSDEL